MQQENSRFSSLDDFYFKIESYPADMGSKISDGLIVLIGDITDDDIKKKLLIEQFVYDFGFKDGEVVPKISMPGENGTLLIYPSFGDIDAEGYNYIEARASTVKNDFLISRYNLALWHSPLKPKKIEAVKKAIDANIRILDSKKMPSNDTGHWIWYESILNALSLSAKVKYQNDVFYQKLTTAINRSRFLDYQNKFFFLNNLSQQPNYLSAYLDDTNKLLTKLIAIAKKKNETTILEQMYEAGLRIAKKSKADTNIWNEHLGDYYVSAAERRMNDETRMIPLNFYNMAIPYYKRAKAKDKVKEIEKRYNLLKKELNLKSVPMPVDNNNLKEISKLIEQQVNMILKLPPEGIYEYLAKSLDVIPDYEKINANSSEGFFMQFFTLLQFDINGNISKTGDQKKKIDPYQLFVSNVTLQFLHRLFAIGIMKRKISYESLINYILQETWLGETFKDSGVNVGHAYNWTSIIAPAIHEYFAQTEFEYKTGQNVNYILAIDSLTLKFEGALRDFCTIIGLSSTKSDKNDNLREKYIEELLTEEKLREYFTENEVHFFNHVFVSKNGYSLRHNVAHCFFRYGNYSFHFMHLLILSFLRLSKHKAKPVNGG